MSTNTNSTASTLVGYLIDTDVQPNQKIYITKLEKAIEKLTNLIREAQFYAEVESQKAPAEAVFFRLDQLLEEVIASTAVRAHFEERDVDVVYLIDPLVPLNLMGDGAQLKNLLLRLLTNAIKSTIQGEILILVDVENSFNSTNINAPGISSGGTTSNNNSKVVYNNNGVYTGLQGHEDETVLLSISVEDTGTGIAPEDIGRIFDPFGLVDHRREDGDLGLGLSICKQLARLFGGTLDVQSELSKGTIFTLVCPFRAHQGVRTITNSPPSSFSMMGGVGIGSGALGSTLPRHWGIGKTIHVIDDNRNVGAVCRMHLEPVGCEVLFFTNPPEALNILRERANDGLTCDAILIDYRIPGFNGEEVARSIRSDTNLKNIPIVLMCSAKQRKLVSLPNTHFLYKPVKKEALLTLVYMLCTSKEREKEREKEKENSEKVFDGVNTNSTLNHHSDTEFTPSPQHPSSTTYDSASFDRESIADPDASCNLLLPTVMPNTPATCSITTNYGGSPTSSAAPSPRIVGQSQGDPEVQSKDSVDSAPAPTPRSSTPPSPSSPNSLNTSTSSDDSSHSQSQSAPFTPTNPSLIYTPSASPSAPASSVPYRKETILLVEDNAINAKIASAVLRRHSFHVELAANGQLALDLVKEYHNHFQLILMDIHMPVMDGLTCAQFVRQFEKDNTLRTIPIIALTADTTPGHRTACLEAGCNEFMSKPLDYPLLIEILKKLNL